MEWVVETGAPTAVAKLSQSAAASSAADHQPDEGVGVGDERRVDDAVLDGADHVAAGDERAGRLEDRRDDDGAGEGDRVRADGGADIVGDVVGADVQRHVAADHRRRDQEHAVGAAGRMGDAIEHDHHDEEQRRPEPEQLPAIHEEGLLDPLHVRKSCAHVLPPSLS